MTASGPIALRHADDDAALRACFPLMRELRPHLASAEAFLDQVHRQAACGYCILAAWAGDIPVSLGGYRVVEMLVRGRYLYVDDLVTREIERGRGMGALVLRALMAEARAAGLGALVLDTAADNLPAHRFYEREGMGAVARRYAIALQ
ncbi:MAG TPA: GNAT family N-acetyltransferase [Acetobacteraceae bacterium]|nr:GNAT family N-acetyltransferase [Acetobacteraceae bacterium]